MILLRNIEERYNFNMDKMLKITCHINLHLKKNPHFTITYKKNLQECIDSCKTNIYCTGIEFSRKRVEYTQIILKNNKKKLYLDILNVNNFISKISMIILPII